MSQALRIYKPERRICAGKAVRYPITKLDPSSWLQHVDYKSIGVDGFTVNNVGQVTVLLSRYEFDGEISNRKYFTQTLLGQFHSEISTLLELAYLINVPYRILLWPKDYPLNVPTDAKRIIIYFPEIKVDYLDLSKAKLLNIEGLEAGLRNYRGRSFNSVKSLRSANSNLECYLANHTKNPWPGDIDGILIDKSTNLVHSILEFKTHNIDSPIEEEFIGKYGQQDWRRFDVLFKLQKAIKKAQGSKPRLYFIVWGTKNTDNHQHIKIDEIHEGNVISTKYINRPQFGKPSLELLAIITGQTTLS